MILYHGSNCNFNQIDLKKSKNNRDFGKGFYTTTIKEQAQQWGYTMYNRLGGDGIFLYEYEFSPSPELTTLRFLEISDEWFDFILKNRTTGDLQHEFDFVQGPVADDKIFLTITGFIDGIFSREEAMQRLRYSKTSDQVSLHTVKAISFLALRDKRKTSPEKLIYNGQELNLIVSRKIEHVVRIIADKEKLSFDAAYRNFSISKTYKSLHNTDSLLWTENAEFIADEYYLEK